MKALGCVLLVGVVVALAGCGGRRAAEPPASPKVAPEPVDATKLVGVWELVKGEEGQSDPVGSTIEFTKDGKIHMESPDKNKKGKVQGTYRVEGSKLIVTTQPVGKDFDTTYSIQKLTDTTLVRRNAGAVEEEYKRKR
jgi:uncharacterized protein (TIGR03066 family)